MDDRVIVTNPVRPSLEVSGIPLLQEMLEDEPSAQVELYAGQRLCIFFNVI